MKYLLTRLAIKHFEELKPILANWIVSEDDLRYVISFLTDNFGAPAVRYSDTGWCELTWSEHVYCSFMEKAE